MRDEEQNGGLLVEDHTGLNAFQPLVSTDYQQREFDTEHHDLVDNRYLNVLIKLRNMGRLKKEDITNHALFPILCSQFIFAQNRFRFLVEWDPNALRQPDSYGNSLLHCAAKCSTSIREFRTVFEAGIRYFSKKKGIHLLFEKEQAYGEAAFQWACKKFGYEQVMDVIEKTLNTNSDFSRGEQFGSD
jgi:hypothetical protein